MAAVTRWGDPDLMHCSPMNRAIGSGNVFVNGRPVSCQSHVNTVHLLPTFKKCVPHAAPITTGSTTVMVNGLGVGRVGDALTACTWTSVGSENVFAGG